MTGIILKSDAGLTYISGFRTINTQICLPRRRRARQGVPAGIAGFVACLCMLPNVSSAEAWIFQPSVRLEGRYDDNLRLVPDNPPAGQQGPQQIATARISPALRLSRVTDTAEIAGLLRVNGDFYFGDTQGGTTDSGNTRNLDNQDSELADFSAFNKGELSRWGGIFSYRRDTLLSPIGANDPGTDPTVNEEENVDNGASSENVRRQRLSLGPSWSRYLTERTQVGLSYVFSDVSLGNLPAPSPTNPVSTRFTDYHTHAVGADLLTRVTERDQLALIFTGQLYRADNDRRSNSYELQAGVVHDFSETTTGIFTIGALYNTFDRPATLTNVADNGINSGLAFTLGGTKRTGLTTFSGVVERTTTPSISGTLVQTNQAIFNVSRKLTERTDFIFRSRIYQIEAVDQLDSSSNRRFLALQPTLRYALSPNWGLEASYEYSRQKRFFDADSADDNAVSLSLVYQLPTAVKPEQPLQDVGIGSFGIRGGLSDLGIE